MMKDTKINNLTSYISLINLLLRNHKLENLKFKTFILKHSATLCDIFLTCAIFHAFKKVMTEELRKKISNIIRHFIYMKKFLKLLLL